MAEQQGTTSDPYVIAGTPDAWSAEAPHDGRTGTQRLLDVATLDAPGEVRSALGLGDDRVRGQPHGDRRSPGLVYRLRVSPA
jgi:hypothetical protein